MTGADRSILSVTCYGHFLSHFNMLVFPALLLPLARRLEMNMADTLDLAFAMYLLMGLSALPWGLLADRFGARPLLALFYGGAGLSALAAARFLDNPTHLSWALAGIGLFSGIYHPAGLGWIACCVSRTSAGMAKNGMFGNLGLAMAPVLAGLGNYFFGPQLVYAGVGLMNLAGLFPLLRTLRLDLVPPVHARPPVRQGSWTGFMILLTAMMLGGIVYRGATVTLPALFEIRGTGFLALLERWSRHELPANVVATGSTSLLYLVGMLGQYYGGRVGERFDLGRGYLVFHLLTIPLALLTGLVTDLPLILFATAHAFFLLGMQPIENTLVARLTPPSMHGSAYGMKFVLTFGVGAMAVQLVRAVEKDLSLAAVYPVLAGVSTLLVCCILVLIRKIGPVR